MVKGFRLIALTEEAETAFRKMDIRDKHAFISKVCESPFTLSFVFKRSLFQNYVTVNSIKVSLLDQFPTLVIDKDYSLEVLQ